MSFHILSSGPNLFQNKKTIFHFEKLDFQIRATLKIVSHIVPLVKRL